MFGNSPFGNSNFGGYTSGFGSSSASTYSAFLPAGVAPQGMPQPMAQPVHYAMPPTHFAQPVHHQHQHQHQHMFQAAPAPYVRTDIQYTNAGQVNPALRSAAATVVSGFAEKGVAPQRTQAALSSAIDNISGPATRADGSAADTTQTTKCPFLKEMYTRAYEGPLALMSAAQQEAFKKELARHVTPEAAAVCPFLAEMGIKPGPDAFANVPHPLPKDYVQPAVVVETVDSATDVGSAVGAE